MPPYPSVRRQGSFKVDRAPFFQVAQVGAFEGFLKQVEGSLLALALGNESEAASVDGQACSLIESVSIHKRKCDPKFPSLGGFL